MKICIFGYAHDWPCTCDFVDIDPSKLNKVVCSKCESVFKAMYKGFLADEKFKNGWDGDFEDFLAVNVNDRLRGVAMEFNNCEYDHELTSKKSEKAGDNLEDLFDKFMIDDEEAELACSYLWNTGC